jgi:hypothetical protein
MILALRANISDDVPWCGFAEKDGRSQVCGLHGTHQCS